MYTLLKILFIAIGTADTGPEWFYDVMPINEVDGYAIEEAAEFDCTYLLQHHVANRIETTPRLESFVADTQICRVVTEQQEKIR